MWWYVGRGLRHLINIHSSSSDTQLVSLLTSNPVLDRKYLDRSQEWSGTEGSCLTRKRKNGRRVPKRRCAVSWTRSVHECLSAWRNCQSDTDTAGGLSDDSIEAFSPRETCLGEPNLRSKK